MTISIDEYWTAKQPVRKKEPQYVAFINKNSCTSCNACATMCPVDCIYEVEGAPSESYHVVDLSRCIGCQMCYRVPSESTGPWTMEICPWNAIDMIHNPNVKQWESLWEPYYVGSDKPNFRKLEEIGYQLYLGREIYVGDGSEYDRLLDVLSREEWSYGEGNFAITRLAENSGAYDKHVCTPAGDQLVDFLYRDYQHVFLD